MARSPETFPKVYTAMVEAGEAGGFLDVVLAQIADFQSREKELRSKVLTAMIYPAVLLLMAAVVLSVLLVFFIPKFQKVFASVKGGLPLITQIIIATSDILRSYGLLVLVGLVLGSFFLKTWIVSPAGQRIWEGLRGEWDSARDPQALHHWIELVHHHTRRLSEPWRRDERLRLLWEEVQSRLVEDWTLKALAHAAHVSEEHFRRLCWKELGRSPMAHLTSLRMQAAQSLLVSTKDKQETIAILVGYRSPIAFARAFKRWVGCHPSEYRARS
jgi:AraC-like DNA-binding protein